MPSLEDMSPKQLQTALEYRKADHSARVDEMIAAGHGQARGSDIREWAKGDTLLSRNRLAARYVATSDALQAAYAEEDKRLAYSGSLRKIPKRA